MSQDGDGGAEVVIAYDVCTGPDKPGAPALTVTPLARRNLEVSGPAC